jgi:hypothetical protein
MTPVLHLLQLPQLGDLLRLTVPGWPQQHRGQRRRGLLLLASFLLLLLGGALLLGASWGSILLGLAFGVHSAGVFDATTSSVAALAAPSRLLRGAVLSIMLALLIYTPISIGVSYVVYPIVILAPASPLAADDVLLVQHAWAPRVGSVVLYNMPAHQITTGAQGGAPRREYGMIYFGGQQVDRILAGPGSQVLWDHGRLLVDGLPSELRPLNAASLPPRLALTVPKDCWLILPTTTPYVGPALADDAWQTLSLVPQVNVVGTVYLRYRPFSRWGPLP